MESAVTVSNKTSIDWAELSDTFSLKLLPDDDKPVRPADRAILLSCERAITIDEECGTGPAVA